ncbi:hypothetical protein CVD25_15295 [Bacillus canaveralius]|uniref:Uncharacterized protein n=1 Tax=Bacillus canaveralius TaxID=1403243 RepID=A0A2N5GKC5_9BACI|nr:hypothetical protein [Bacillus canaveralius]PLR81832.1 hypothetical protein CU635_13820 [Bacillus canaveralius]PLR94986.1 hypothetical protein CVD25_15295 [Bacillus canaveralius]
MFIDLIKCLRSITIRKEKGENDDKKQPSRLLSFLAFILFISPLSSLPARSVQRNAANGTGTYGM